MRDAILSHLIEFYAIANKVDLIPKEQNCKKTRL